MAACYKCGSELEARRPSRSDVCPSCGLWVRCCRNCQHFRPPNDCAEPHAEWIRDRTAANFCELFALADRAPGATATAGPDPDKPDPFDELFKK